MMSTCMHGLERIPERRDEHLHARTREDSGAQPRRSRRRVARRRSRRDARGRAVRGAAAARTAVAVTSCRGRATHYIRIS